MNKFLKFEALLESDENKLTGGFSSSISSKSAMAFDTTNNCHGGNCAVGCAAGSNNGCKPVKTGDER